jgi:hypothetical protein
MANTTLSIPPMVPVTLQAWQALALLEVAAQLNAAGGSAAITRGIGQRIGSARGTNGRSNGRSAAGATNIVPGLIQAFVAQTPGGIKRREIVEHLAEQGTKIGPTALNTLLAKMKTDGLVKVRGRRGGMRFLPATV